jgi:hypothetical protein
MIDGKETPLDAKKRMSIIQKIGRLKLYSFMLARFKSKWKYAYYSYNTSRRCKENCPGSPFIELFKVGLGGFRSYTVKKRLLSCAQNNHMR